MNASDDGSTELSSLNGRTHREDINTRDARPWFTYIAIITSLCALFTFTHTPPDLTVPAGTSSVLPDSASRAVPLRRDVGTGPILVTGGMRTVHAHGCARSHTRKLTLDMLVCIPARARIHDPR